MTRSRVRCTPWWPIMTPAWARVMTRWRSPAGSASCLVVWPCLLTFTRYRKPFWTWNCGSDLYLEAVIALWGMKSSSWSVVTSKVNEGCDQGTLALCSFDLTSCLDGGRRVRSSRIHGTLYISNNDVVQRIFHADSCGGPCGVRCVNEDLSNWRLAYGPIDQNVSLFLASKIFFRHEWPAYDDGGTPCLVGLGQVVSQVGHQRPAYWYSCSGIDRHLQWLDAAVHSLDIRQWMLGNGASVSKRNRYTFHI